MFIKTNFEYPIENRTELVWDTLTFDLELSESKELIREEFLQA